MEVTLLHNTPLPIADTAIGKCWDKQSKEGYCNIDRIYRVANKNKHSSTIEHLSYTFDIDGISRACLQELARHRMANLSVKSTRYTLKELKDAEIDQFDDFLVSVDESIDFYNIDMLLNIRRMLRLNISNDKLKYMLPEAYKTSLTWTINARSLQNFLSLRTDRSALWEIRDLAYEIYDAVPEDHTFLFNEFIKSE